MPKLGAVKFRMEAVIVEITGICSVVQMAPTELSPLYLQRWIRRIIWPAELSGYQMVKSSARSWRILSGQ